MSFIRVYYLFSLRPLKAISIIYYRIAKIFRPATVLSSKVGNSLITCMARWKRLWRHRAGRSRLSRCSTEKSAYSRFVTDLCDIFWTMYHANHIIYHANCIISQTWNFLLLTFLTYCLLDNWLPKNCLYSCPTLCSSCSYFLVNHMDIYNSRSSALKT